MLASIDIGCDCSGVSLCERRPRARRRARRVWVSLALAASALALAAGLPSAAHALAVQHDSYVATETAGSSDNDGIIGPGDGFTLTERVISAETTQTLTNVTGALSSADGSAVINQGTSAYPNLAFGVSTGNSTPFSLTVPSSAACGVGLPLNLQLSTAQGSVTVPFTVATGATAPYASYTSAQVPLSIPSPGVLVSTLNVAAPRRVKGVRVSIGRINETYDGDLKIELVAPDGTPVTLINPNLSNSGQNFVNTVFDPSAPTSITSGSAPYTGSFRPAGDLSVLNGKQQQGTWQLKVTDVYPGDTGSLVSWGASVAPAVCTNNPIASLTASPNPAPTGATVTFDGSGSVAPTQGATITDYRWDLDGSGAYATDTGSTPTVTRVYGARGSVNVGLRVTDSTGKTGQSTILVSITQPPVAAMSVSPANPVAASPVSFDAGGSTADPAGRITDYRWDLDGSGNYATDTGATPRVTTTYPTSRTVPVHVRVTDDTGATATAGQAVTIANAPPTASFAVPAPVLVGQPATLDASSSNDPDGSISDYRWDLSGSGSYSTDTGATPRVTATFGAPGLVNVGLRVTDNEGASATTTRPVQVTRPPVARIGAAPNPAGPGVPVILDASASSDPDGIVTSYRWDLDGSGSYATSTGPTPFLVHAFGSPGSYPVSVLVTDNYGATATATVTVVVPSAGPGGGGGGGAPGGGSVPSPTSLVSALLAGSGDPAAGIARLSASDLETIIPGSDNHFAAITGAAVRRTRTVAAQGLWVNALADRAASFALTVSVSAADAQRLDLPRRTGRGHRAGARAARRTRKRGRQPSLVELGRGSTRLTVAGQRPLRIGLGSKARAALRRRRGRVALLVIGSAVDAAGHRTKLARAFLLRP
jgi:subtilisin-like proprotein convertase family protein